MIAPNLCSKEDGDDGHSRGKKRAMWLVKDEWKKHAWERNVHGTNL